MSPLLPKTLNIIQLVKYCCLNLVSSTVWANSGHIAIHSALFLYGLNTSYWQTFTETLHKLGFPYRAQCALHPQLHTAHCKLLQHCTPYTAHYFCTLHLPTTHCTLVSGQCSAVQCTMSHAHVEYLYFAHTRPCASGLTNALQNLTAQLSDFRQLHIKA